MIKFSSEKSVGLVLGGGAVLGAAHIGVLKALEELKVRIDYLCGTSIGALVATLYAFGKDWQEMKKIAMEMDWLKISSVRFSKYGLMNNEKLGSIVTEAIGEKDIINSNIPLNIVTTNISNGEKVVLKEGNASKAVMASTCIPGIFEPVKIKGKFLVDGGVVENVPAITAREMGAEQIIVVHLNAINSLRDPENIIDIIVNTFAFAIESAVQYQINESDILIEPDLSNFNPTSTDQISDLIEVGYNEAVNILK